MMVLQKPVFRRFMCFVVASPAVLRSRSRLEEVRERIGAKNARGNQRFRDADARVNRLENFACLFVR
jgi:hypothetical protein